MHEADFRLSSCWNCQINFTLLAHLFAIVLLILTKYSLQFSNWFIYLLEHTM